MNDRQKRAMIWDWLKTKGGVQILESMNSVIEYLYCDEYKDYMETIQDLPHLKKEHIFYHIQKMVEFSEELKEILGSEDQKRRGSNG